MRRPTSRGQRCLTSLAIDVVPMRAEIYLASEPSEKFDIAFLDPPYDVAESDLALVLELLVPHLAEDAIVVS